MSVVSTTPVSHHSGGGSNRFHWTVDTFYRAVDAGIFDEPKRLELIYGDLREKETVNPPHAITTACIAEKLRESMEQVCIREEKPVRLSNDTEPLPDIVVATGRHTNYLRQHPIPQEIVLLIEVADTTVNYDTGEKARLYASSGIGDYWVVLINQRELLVLRDPTPEGYASQGRFTEDDSITPLATPEITIFVRDLLPPVD